MILRAPYPKHVERHDNKRNERCPRYEGYIDRLKKSAKRKGKRHPRKPRAGDHPPHGHAGDDKEFPADLWVKWRENAGFRLQQKFVGRKTSRKLANLLA